MIKSRFTYGFLAAAALWFFNCLPGKLFVNDYSKVLYDRNGELLGAKTSVDGQWRFPVVKELPKQFILPLITFEDKRFFHHKGVDPIAVCRAFVQNIKAKSIVSGASTLTMQVLRLSRPGKPRSLAQKAYEAILSLRLEISHSKREIINLYASQAPFGGNVVGIEAASWRYFNKPPSRLTWAEGATLAVLPNAPSLIHPGRNRDQLKAKRDRLLKKMSGLDVIDSLEYQLALLEPLPENPHPLPRNAPHLMEYSNGINEVQITHLDLQIQKNVVDIVNLHDNINRRKEINNAAVLISDNTTGEVIAYVGNTSGTDHENYVDMVPALRSSGSILKPLLYGMMLQDGKMSPHEMLADVPTSIDGFRPKNYNKKFNGAVKASDALAMSLNVPAVGMLQKYGIEAFRSNARSLGINTLTYSSGHYGLSLILGGAEVSLFDLVNVYSRMAQKLNFYQSEKTPVDIHLYGPSQQHELEEYDHGVIYSVFESMQKLVRPDTEGGWQHFSSSIPIAWKTGTSYGHRDAWALGITPQYTIGVWVGNSDGEGRPEIIGSVAAGTLLFDVLNVLPNSGNWFTIPHDDLLALATCSVSGYLAGIYCETVDTLLSPRSTIWAQTCPYHSLIFVDSTGKRADKHCYPEVNKKYHFVLPPDMAHYYRKNHPEYSDLPAYNPRCHERTNASSMALLYPSSFQSLYLPSGLNGEKKYPVFKASHKDDHSKIFWHLDDTYIGYTQEIHEMKIAVSPGSHKISLIDGGGNVVNRTFEVVGE